MANLKKIQETIEKGRTASMPAWGPALGEEGVKNVTQYVMSLSKPKGQYDEERAERGKALFSGPPANCFTCHGDKGQGIQGLGPNLTDDVWLWGRYSKSDYRNHYQRPQQPNACLGSLP